MTYGLLNDNGKVTFATDGNGCYDIKTSKCYCADCYYYGCDNVNCAHALLTVNDGLVPIKWDSNKKEFVVVQS